ncbi:nuclear transport factor 2 family protein [uncultured Roseobacter sp.]|uniref:nuclear transport factor 2 family protein n=1 Tax=uncultured Roseobacter sp. TaxID=114847 RepID=UPI002639E744|nr:nuclear transport factor 2 family protein [uncultured Roseobacter sp.]
MNPKSPTLEQRVRSLEDRNYIHEITSRFADSANRVDPDAFVSLWAQDAIWQIGPPISKEFKGHDEIRSAFLGLLCNAWEFFIQMPSAHVIEIDGATATASSFVNEVSFRDTCVNDCLN